MNFQTKSCKGNNKSKYFKDPAKMDLERPVIVVFVFVRYWKYVSLGVAGIPDNHHQQWEETWERQVRTTFIFEENIVEFFLSL